MNDPVQSVGWHSDLEIVGGSLGAGLGSGGHHIKFQAQLDLMQERELFWCFCEQMMAEHLNGQLFYISQL